MAQNRSSFITVIDLNIAEKLREDLLDRGFLLTTPNYTIFSAKKPGLTCTLYTSGKLVVQGKDKDDFIAFYLEPEILHTFTHESVLSNWTPHIGVDEAGKGDFFGPLCVAAVYADTRIAQEFVKQGIKDSKTIKDHKIHILKKSIQMLCPHAVIRIFPERYNVLYSSFRNLNHFLAWGHAKAIEEVYKKTQCPDVTIDQFAYHESVVKTAVSKRGYHIALTQKHGAESDLAVAAASILARGAFLEGLAKLSKEVGIDLPKGASRDVITIGKKLVAKHGKEILTRVAKLHFKTTDSVL